MNEQQDMTITALQAAYKNGELTPTDLMASIRAQAADY